jgi:hypothetical protein
VERKINENLFKVVLENWAFMHYEFEFWERNQKRLQCSDTSLTGESGSIVSVGTSSGRKP